MAGWFNIQAPDARYLIQAAANAGAGWSALGDVVGKFGGILNAERDRKYAEEQDKLKNSREDKKLEGDLALKQAQTDYQNAGVTLRGIQGEQAIRSNDIKSAHNKATEAQGWANVGINQQKANNDLYYKQGRLAQYDRDLDIKSNNGGSSRGGSSSKETNGKKLLQSEINEKFNSKKYSQNIKDFLDTEL